MKTQTPSSPRFTLIRGCALMSDRRLSQSSQYFLGTLQNVVAVTSTYQRSALLQLAEGSDPLSLVPLSVREELESFIDTLDRHGFLNTSNPTLIRAKRYLDGDHDKDLSIQQIRNRATPELAQCEWIDKNGDGGVATLTARAQFPILLSGRSRVMTLLYSLLLASGVTKVRFADHHLRTQVEDLDIGIGTFTSNSVGLSFYEELEAQRRVLSLFPIEHGSQIDRSERATVVVHYGDYDPEQLIEWSNQQMPYLLIQQPIGDEILIGPLVLPSKTPCQRCLSLYEIDNFGFTTFERLPLTTIEEVPIVTAHFLAAVVASQILNFIDSNSDQRISRNTGIGEVTYINFQKLTEPQVVALPRHPLCGCDW